MKILIVATVPHHIRAFHLPVARSLAERGHVVHAAASGISEMRECVSAFSSVHDVPFSRNPLALWRIAASVCVLHKLLVGERYDIVHVHTPIAAFVTRVVAGALGSSMRASIVYTAHGFHFIRGGGLAKNCLYLMMEAMAGCWTDYLSVINSDDLAAAKFFNLVSDERIVSMPGAGIDLMKFRPPADRMERRRAVRKHLGLAENAKIVLMVAELSRVKRHRDALHAIALLRGRGIHLICCGAGVAADELAALAISLGIQDNVHFVGFRDDVSFLLGGADVSLLVSEREGLPMSILESLATGVPVVGTDVRGISDLLATIPGALVRKGDVSGIAAAIVRMLDRLNSRWGAADSSAAVVERYALKNVIEVHLRLYEKCGRSQGWSAQHVV